MNATITISRAERDLILAQLWRFAPTSDDDALPFGTRDEAENSIRRMQWAMTLRDQLGWDDDPRAVFTVTPDPRIVEMLRDEADSWVSEREHEIEYRETHILRLRPTRHGTTWADDFPTIEEAIAKVDDGISRAEEWRRACEDLIARIDAELVTA